MDESRMRNLGVAQSNRMARLEWKKALHDGTVTLGEVLDERPPCLLSMPVYELLREVPGVGRIRVERMNVTALSELRLNLVRPLGKLATLRSKQLLALLEREWPCAALRPGPRQLVAVA